MAHTRSRPGRPGGRGPGGAVTNIPLGSRPPTFTGGGTAGTGTTADPFRRAGGGGGTATTARTAAASQKAAKNKALNDINALISRATGAERTRLIQERNKISNINAIDFTSSVISSVQQTISREQQKVSPGIEMVQRVKTKEQESKTIQQAIFENQLRKARTEQERARILTQARIAGFSEVIPEKVTITAGPVLEEGRLDVTARGKVVTKKKKEDKKKEDFKLTTGGIPLTIIRIPKKLEVTPPELTEFEKRRIAIKKVSIPSLAFVLGKETFRTLRKTSEDIRAGVLGKVEDIAKGITERPIGVIRTGEIEFIRDITAKGKVIREERRIVKAGEPVLLPIIPETLGPPTRVVGGTLQFVFETAPKGIVKAGQFIISKEGREAIAGVTKTTIRMVKEEPKATVITAGVLATKGILSLIRGIGKEFRERPIAVAVEAGIIGRGIQLIGKIPRIAKRKITEIKFERGIKRFEREITDKKFKFDPTREIFVPTGRKIIDLKKGRVIIETEAIKRGFPVFGEAGEIVGRQLQLKPRFKPEFEPQAEFIQPALGVERVIKLQDDFLGKFVRRPLTPLQQIAARETQRVIRITPEIQKTLIEFKFKPLRPQKITFIIEFRKPPRFVGEVFQIGGLIPPQIIKPEIPFERFGGKFFERVRKPQIPKLEIPIKPRRIVKLKPLAIFKSAIGISAITISRLPTKLKEISISIIKPITELGIKPIERLRIFEKVTPREEVFPIIRPRVAVEPRIRAKIREDIELKSITIPKIDIEPITRPILEPKPPIKKEPIKPKPSPSPKLRFDFDRKRRLPKPAFTTEVREGERKADKFIRVRKQTLPRQRAINLGARIADNTTARTFRIKRRGTTALSDTGRFPLKDKFRGRIGKSKLPPKVFVEKSKFAIDSPGERLGIPFNPLRIPRLREAIARKQARKTIRRIPKPLTTGRGRTMVFL